MSIADVEGHSIVHPRRFQLNDPVSTFIPEFKEPKILASGNGQDPNGGVTKAKREITIKDLLTHTSGLTYQTIMD